LLTVAVSGHEHAIQERLGYSADTKLLIIHADDLAMAHSKNVATFKSMKEGVVTSASVMMPCPWVLEVLELDSAHPEADLGIHITLTAEWKHYKWGPLSGKDEVPSLVTAAGYFHDNVPDFAAAAKIDEIEREVRAQVEYAKKLGLEFSHFDGHMNSMTATDEIKELYVRLGNEYGVPVRVHQHAGAEVSSEELKQALGNYPANLTEIYGAPPETYPDGMVEYYNDVLRNLSPGLNLLVLHIAYDDPEMQAITVEHPHWGALWRQIDFDWATSPETKAILEEEGIVLIDFSDVQEALF
jgi:predicted glycoside hydrolase/deacetylase ChbG (UPF0249 family)